MRWPHAVPPLLVLACSGSSAPAPVQTGASGCAAFELDEYCADEPEACRLSTLHQASALDPFLRCQQPDAGACCPPLDVECRARWVEQIACPCVDAQSSRRYTRVQLATGFNGRAYYYARDQSLVAAQQWVDTNAFCHHSSSERWYGRVLECTCEPHANSN
jgi:hypothetical protein